MISLIGSTTPADTNGAFAVLALIADKDAAAARLKELVEQAQANQKILDEIAATRKQAEADKLQAAATMRSANNLMAKNQKTADEISARKDQLQLMSESVARRSEELSAAIEAHSRKVAEQEEEMAKRDAKTKALLDQAMADAAAAEKARADYEGRLAKLQQLATG